MLHTTQIDTPPQCPSAPTSVQAEQIWIYEPSLVC
jgi:hypothetical protein